MATFEVGSWSDLVQASPRTAGDMLLRFRRRIWTLAALAALFATPALYLGLVYFRQ